MTNHGSAPPCPRKALPPIPGDLIWDDVTGHMMEATIKVYVDIAFDTTPTPTELAKAVFDNAVVYIDTVREFDSDEHIVEGRTSIGFDFRHVEAHPI